MPGTAARRAQHPRRQVDTELADQEPEVPGDADRDHGHDRGVLQQQVPADEPAGQLAEHRVPVRVCRTRLGDEPGELGVREGGRRTGHPRHQEREHHRGPGGLVGHGPGEGEDAGADDAAHADRGELPQAEGPGQLTLVLGRDLLDRLAPEHTRSATEAPLHRRHETPQRRAPVE